MEDIKLPEEFELTDVEGIVHDKERGFYHLMIDGKISKYGWEDTASWLGYTIQTDKSAFGEYAANVIKRSLRANYLSGYSVPLSTLFEKSLVEKTKNEYIKRGYSIDRAYEKSGVRDFKQTKDGLLVGYIPVELLHTKFQYNPKKDDIELVDAFPKTVTVNPYSGDTKVEFDYDADIEDFAFHIGDHIVGVGWLVGHVEETKGSFTIYSKPTILNREEKEYAIVYFDPANITNVEYDSCSMTNSITVSKLFVKAYRNKDEDIHVKSEIKSAEYAERCDEEWEEFKARVVKQAEKAKEKVVDFDVN